MPTKRFTNIFGANKLINVHAQTEVKHISRISKIMRFKK